MGKMTEIGPDCCIGVIMGGLSHNYLDNYADQYMYSHVNLLGHSDNLTIRTEYITVSMDTMKNSA